MVDYQAYLGNGLTGMLVNNNGIIEWLCAPVFDSNPIFAYALNKSKGGSIQFFILDEESKIPFSKLETIEVDYLNDYPIFKSTLYGLKYFISSFDYMPTNSNCYIKRIDFYNSNPDKLLLNINFFSGSDKKIEYQNNNIRVSGGPLDIYISSNRKLSLKDKDIILDLENHRNCLVHFNFKTICLKNHNISEDLEHWFYFFKDKVNIEVGHQEIRSTYRRSLQVLYNLIYQPTGAIVAAPTTSIPDTFGLDNNWDYRFCWIRDASFSVEALAMANCLYEAKKILEFIFNTQEKDGRWKYPLYSITGKKPPKEKKLDIREDYGGSIRIGNQAANQIQIDSEGSVLDAVLNYYQHSGDLLYLDKIFPKLEKAANIILDNWGKKENGLWEFRGRKYNYTYGKAICASGLKSFLNISKILGKEIDESRYMDTIQKIMYLIYNKGFSKISNTFVQAFENKIIDSSVLALTLRELISVYDPKMKGTLEKIIKVLDRDGGYARYENERNPFYLSTFWLIRTFILTGDFQKYLDLLTSTMHSSSKLNLMGEHFYPHSMEQRGNFPQAFSHLEFIKSIIEGFFRINRDFKVILPINIFKTGFIDNFRLLGKEISLNSHLDEQRARVYINAPIKTNFLVPKINSGEIEIIGGKLSEEQFYYEIISNNKLLKILY
jgi:GH15 family glucan-1,4-alpha-glucosidase